MFLFDLYTDVDLPLDFFLHLNCNEIKFSATTYTFSGYQSFRDLILKDVTQKCLGHRRNQ